MRDNRSLFYYLYKLTGLAVATAKSHNELQKNEKCEFFSIIQKWNSHRKAENDIIRAQAVSKWFSLLLIYPECNSNSVCLLEQNCNDGLSFLCC